jgi:hypothetical protein
MMLFTFIGIVFFLAWLLTQVQSYCPAPSAREVRLFAVYQQSLRLESWKSNLLYFCFSDLSLLFLAVILLGLFKISGFFILAFAGLGFLCARLKPALLEKTAALVLYIGLSYFVLENSARFFMGQHEEVASWVSVFAENRPHFLFFFALLAVSLFAVLRIENFALALGLLGLTGGWMSFSFAAVIFVSERIGSAIRSYFAYSQQSQSVVLMSKALLACYVLTFPVGLLLLGFIRDLQGASIFNISPDQIMPLYILYIFCFLLPNAVALCIWGHFAAQKIRDDLSLPVKACLTSVELGILSTTLLRKSHVAASRRKAEIEQLSAQFEQSGWQGVPAFIRKTSSSELATLKDNILKIETILLSRSKFFIHQV